jgi:hypothetical protein
MKEWNRRTFRLRKRRAISWTAEQFLPPQQGPRSTQLIRFFFNSHMGRGVQIGSTRHIGHFWPILPAPGDCEGGEFGGIKIGRGNQSTRTKPAPEPLCPPQIPLEQVRARTRAAAMGSQRLTA